MKNLIISLTSYPKRIKFVHQTILTLLKQNTKADKVILWLAKEEFLNLYKDLPHSLTSIDDKTFEIKWTTNIKSYKKLVPTLKYFSDDIIVTADDDILYPKNWLEKLYHAHKNNPHILHCYRAHYVSFNKNGEILPYNNWTHNISKVKPSFNLFPTGAGGVIYSLKLLYREIFKEDIFMKICPNADDIWFWAMCVLNNTKVNVIGNGIINVNEKIQGESLWQTNSLGENDIQLKNIFNHYPILLEKLQKNKIIKNALFINIKKICLKIICKFLPLKFQRQKLRNYMRQL